MDVAFFLFDGVTALDAVGPYEVLRRVPGARVRFVGRAAGWVEAADRGLGLRVTHPIAIDDRPDVVVVPGGPGWREAAADEEVLRWLRTVHRSTWWTTSVCTGALVLAAAGLLRGVRATTHARAMGALGAHGAIAVNDRYVFDGRVATSAGVSAGIDLAFAVVERVAGADVARRIATVLEYPLGAVPPPPPSSGAAP